MDSGLGAGLGPLGVGLVSVGALGTMITVLADWAAHRWLRVGRRARKPAFASVQVDSVGEELPPISVLRPVKGMDVGLRENFEVLLGQLYPEFEVLVGAESFDDPALEIAHEVARASRVPMRVIICPVQTGLNPKVSILEALAKEARYDAVLISDSNVRVRQGYLENLGRKLKEPGVGLVTNIVLGETPGTVAAVLETLQLITFVARATLFARQYFGHACVVGKSMLFRLSDWTRLGGFAQVRNVLAEDYVMGHLYSAAGFEVALAPDPVPVPLRQWTWSQLFNRHLRWAQMRRRVSLGAYLIEPLLYPTPSLLLGIAICSAVEARVMVQVGLACLLVRCIWDAGLIFAVTRGRAALWWCFGAPLKDCFALALWCIGGVKRSLVWRGNRLVISRGSRLEREREDIELAAEGAG